ncbi:pentapeptide repeat-containing protein [Bradyrhizobium iriomotense]|uniref:pentapeptide repeat-containing protein n=1 Tax=Bradyrhizobium iriomotense TaxID=441950 RepID=UPI003D66C2EB
MKGANLNRTKFKVASLRSTSLEDADLTGAKFEQTNMLGAFFANTNVTGVDFGSVELRRAQLSGMCISPGGKRPILPKRYDHFDVPVCCTNPLARWFALSRAALAQALCSE